MTIKPLADKVVVKKLQAEETTKSGIILSSGAQQKPQIAEIIAVGPGGVVDGNEIKMEVKVGEKVIIRDYAGTNVKLDGEEYIIVRQDDIAAIVDELNGSPLVKDRLTSYTTKQRVMLRKMHCTKLERISGMITFLMDCEEVQPSIFDASCTSFDTLMKPAT